MCAACSRSTRRWRSASESVPTTAARNTASVPITGHAGSKRIDWCTNAISPAPTRTTLIATARLMLCIADRRGTTRMSTRPHSNMRPTSM
jgi:hypothetical protein